LEVAHRRLIPSNPTTLTALSSFDGFPLLLTFPVLHLAYSTSFLVDIVVNNPFFVARNHTLQERIVFFAFDELIANVHAIRQMNFFQLMRYPNIELLYEA